MKSSFQRFEMERLMSKWENRVEYNLSESGVHPVTLGELLSGAGNLDRILSLELNYPQANGIPELRERIAALYPGATPDHVLVTVGCIEANYLAMQTLLSPGDEMALMIPNYMQLWGLAKNMGVRLQPFYLEEEKGWTLKSEPDISDQTRMVAVCNPNNPTGHVLSPEEMDILVRAAEKSGAWLLADEVYAGGERVSEEITPSFWGRYDRVLAMGSLSKAYGLPGLRLGWVVGPPEIVDEMWARHEYLTISASLLSNHLAAMALEPSVREQLLKRARGYIRDGYPVLEEWVDKNSSLFSVVPPDASAIAFIRYHMDENSSRLIERLIHEESVLIIPGDHFGFDRHFRISFGLPPDFLRKGLDRILRLVRKLKT
jgi:aspartate/methionine/tyrosine aminotransferase